MPDEVVSLRDFLVHLIEEKDKQYTIRFLASETAVTAALNAQKEAVNNAFVASEKAIAKAEEAQAAYNARSNEFRASLSDQAMLFMPRNESVTIARGLEEKILTMQKGIDARINAHIVDNEKFSHSLMVEISGLRESRSKNEGKGARSSEIWAWITAAAALILAAFGHLDLFKK